MNPAMKDSLSAALQTELAPRLTHAHNLPEVVTVTLLEDGSIRVAPINSGNVAARLKNPGILFLELRRKIRELTEDSSWTVRYASQVSNLLPFLHSSSQLKILFDPLSPYRSPIEALSKEGVLILSKVPSHIHYFKPKNEAIHDSSSQGTFRKSGL